MYCENCGVRDGETDKQLFQRKGVDPTNYEFDLIPFVVTWTEWGYVCQLCKDFSGKGRHYFSATGEARTFPVIPIAWGVDENSIPEDIEI